MIKFNKNFCNKNNCTCWFDKYKEYNWGKCCKEHDNDYMLNNDITKKEADNKLYECLLKNAPLIMAILMISAIKYLPFSYYYWNYYKKEIK